MIYMMMLPRRNEFNLLDDIFGDLDYTENKIMKTDIKEHKDNYSIMVDLPGYNVLVEDIKSSFKNGTLNLTIPKKEQKQIAEKKYVQIED